jgi:hypothetical protein
MQSSGNQLLAGAALAADQLGGAPVRDPPDGTTYVLDGVAGAKKTKGRPPRDGKVDGMKAKRELASDRQDEPTA